MWDIPVPLKQADWWSLLQVIIKSSPKGSFSGSAFFPAYFRVLGSYPNAGRNLSGMLLFVIAKVEVFPSRSIIFLKKK